MNIINRKTPTYFIAEIGQNHQGDINIAKKMVDSLKGLSVNCIKTAKRDIDICLSEEQKIMIYNNPNSFGRTYYEHRKALELSHDHFIELKNYVEDAGFDFISSFTDKNSLDFLCEIGISGLKIASQRTSDIDTAVNILKYNKELHLLQCTSTYPCPEEDLNLNVIPAYKDRYNQSIDTVGFSGHHIGVASDIAAYMLGAEIIERHYTLDRTMKGTDHPGSLEKRGLEYVLNKALGSSKKEILKSELPALKKLRG